jgi:hypothetical protein
MSRPYKSRKRIISTECRMTNLFEKDLDKFRKNPDIASMLKSSQSILLGRDEFMDWMFGRHDTRNKQKAFTASQILEVAEVLKRRCVAVGLGYTQTRIQRALHKTHDMDIIVMVDKLGYSNATSIKSVYNDKIVIGSRLKGSNHMGRGGISFWVEGTVVRVDDGIPQIRDDQGNVHVFRKWKFINQISKKKQVITSSVQQKLQFVQGFLVSELGECLSFPNVYSVSIVCTGKVAAMKVVRRTLKNVVGADTSTKGSILVGAFLYCVKGGEPKTNEMALLELAGSYKNIAGYLAYTKVGFDPDYVLIQHKCYELNEFMLPMTANLNPITQSDIIGYITGTQPRKFIHDPFQFYNLASRDKETQIKMAKYLSEIVENYRLAVISLLKLKPESSAESLDSKTIVIKETVDDNLNSIEYIKSLYLREFDKTNLPKLILLPGLKVFKSTILEDLLPDADSSLKSVHSIQRNSNDSRNGSSSIHSIQRNSRNRSSSMHSIQRNSNDSWNGSSSTDESKKSSTVPKKTSKLARLNELRNVAYI